MKARNLNQAYRLVWSEVHQAFIAVAEFSRSSGKRSGKAAVVLATASLVVAAGVADAVELPTGGQIVAGSGAISQSGSTLTVTQTSGKMAADWQSFSIGQGHTVNFIQPSASAVALNRVLGSNVSVIQGALNANGHVFLVNPNGVLFTPTAQVNVGGLVASTLNISADDFLAGNYRFSANSTAGVKNEGHITTIHGGTVALIAARIENTGSITAPQGQVLMGAGSTVRLDLGGPVKIEVEEGALNTLAARANFTGRAITTEFAQETLRDLLRAQQQAIGIPNIQKTVADYYGLQMKDLLGKKRTRSLARPRQVAMAMTKELTEHSLPEIGDAFGGRDHTTVLHACRQIRTLMETDGKLREDWDKLIRKLSE